MAGGRVWNWAVVIMAHKQSCRSVGLTPQAQI